MKADAGEAFGGRPVGTVVAIRGSTFASLKPLPVPPPVSAIKLRKAGFGGAINTEDCIIDHLDAMRAQRYLPGVVTDDEVVVLL